MNSPKNSAIKWATTIVLISVELLLSDCLLADALVQGSASEVRIGPIKFSQSIEGAKVDLRASLFGSFRVSNGELLSGARLVFDLTDIQNHVGRWIQKGKLPNDSCGLKIFIDSESVSAEGNYALFKLAGDVQLWGCALGVKTRIFKIPYLARVHARLESPDHRHIVVRFDEPEVDFDGIPGKLGANELGATLVKDALGDLESKLRVDPIPQELLPYQPSIELVRIFPNDGLLAGEVFLGLRVGNEPLTELAQRLIDDRK